MFHFSESKLRKIGLVRVGGESHQLALMIPLAYANIGRTRNREKWPSGRLLNQSTHVSSVILDGACLQISQQKTEQKKGAKCNSHIHTKGFSQWNGHSSHQKLGRKRSNNNTNNEWIRSDKSAKRQMENFCLVFLAQYQHYDLNCLEQETDPIKDCTIRFECWRAALSWFARLVECTESNFRWRIQRKLINQSSHVASSS